MDTQTLNLGSLNNLSNLFELNLNTANSSKQSERIKCLKEYQFLVEKAAEAARAFFERDLAKFDPNIGDCACQIRTVKTLLLVQDDGVCSEMETFAKQAKQVEEACICRLARFAAESDPKKILVQRAGAGTLSDIPSDITDIQLTLTESVAYLVQAYLFTLTHEIFSPSEDNPLFTNARFSHKQLCAISEGRMTGNRANRIIWKIRENLSVASLQFIREQAKRMGNLTCIRACFSPEFTRTMDDILYSVPMFHSYRVLLETCRREAIPILFKVKLRAVCLSKELDTCYVPLDPKVDRIDPNTRYCVFEGVRVCQETAESGDGNPSGNPTYNMSLRGDNGRAVILAGAADHPQYAKGNAENERVLRGLLPGFLRVRRYQVLAEKIGCCETNPTLFFIQHVYPQSGRYILQEEMQGTQNEGIDDV